MKFFILIALALFQLTSFAQVNIDIKQYLAHNGGNGGDDDEIMIKSNLMQIGVFLDSSDGKVLFGNDLDSKVFLETVKSVDIRVVEQELNDKFNLKRCALNFPTEKLVVFNRTCLDNLRNNVNDLYVLLSHEILNVMGLELPDERGGSVYTISTRIGALGALVVAKSKDVILSNHCNLALESTDIDYDIKLPRMATNILKDKGYNFDQERVWGNRGKKLILRTNVIDQKYDKYKIDGNKVTFRDGSHAYIESSFLNNKFNGLLVTWVEGSSKEVIVPAPVRIRTYGEQYDTQLKGFWMQSFIEGLMHLPACVKY